MVIMLLYPISKSHVTYSCGGLSNKRRYKKHHSYADKALNMFDKAIAVDSSRDPIMVMSI